MPLETPAPQLSELAERVHRDMTGRLPNARPRVAFYPYVEGRSQVRERDGRLEYRLSDRLLGAPDDIVEGILRLLTARIRRLGDARADGPQLSAYRDHMVESRGTTPKRTGRKHIDPIGTHRSLLESYLRVTLDMDLTLDRVPQLSWSKTVSGHRFGHWDADHNVVVISQILDDPDVPEFVLDYVLYHELLHIVHPVRMGSGSKRIVHSAAFRRDERKYPRWRDGDGWITKLATRARRERNRR